MRYVRMFWRSVAEEFGRSKFYILAAVLLFAYGIYTGYTSRAMDEGAEQLVQQMFGQILEQIESSESPGFTSILLIFINNVRAVFLMMLMGMLLAIVPVISMVFNGVLLGFVLRSTVVTGPLWETIVTDLLPHGIFELPAIFIAAGYGIRFGVTLVRRLFPSQRLQVQTFSEILKSGIPLFGFLVILLFVAAIIEGLLITFALQV